MRGADFCRSAGVSGEATARTFIGKNQAVRMHDVAIHFHISLLMKIFKMSKKSKKELITEISKKLKSLSEKELRYFYKVIMEF